MRHRKHTFKIGPSSSYRRCLMANLLKSLVLSGRVTTTVTKGKELRRFADRAVTLAKKNTLASRRRAIAMMMVRFNRLSSKEARAARQGDHSAYNGDRQVIDKLFGELGPHFAERPGGYTRLVRLSGRRHGDNAEQCIVEYV